MDKTVTTTAGKKFTETDHVALARLVYRRFGNDLGAATRAWQRMLQNSCSEADFNAMLKP